MINIEFHTVREYQIMEQNKKHLTSSIEDYIEMIYRRIFVIGIDQDFLLTGAVGFEPSTLFTNTDSKGIPACRI